MSTNVKVESGIQLISRLMKKPGIANFYPILFENGPKQGDIIELFSDACSSSLLFDMICKSLLPVELGGMDAGILIISTDGNLDVALLLENYKNKLKNCMKNNTSQYNLNNQSVDKIFQASIKKLFFVEIFDSTQFYVTIQNLENILLKNCDISFVIFDTLTAFYWCEQGYKISKMDSYIKSLLTTIQRVTKDSKITILYTRCCSAEEGMEKLECSSGVQLNYRIHVVNINDATYKVIVRTHDKQIQRHFVLCEGFISWL